MGMERHPTASNAEKCEQICPQQLKIRDLLCDVAAEFEKKEA